MFSSRKKTNPHSPTDATYRKFLRNGNFSLFYVRIGRGNDAIMTILKIILTFLAGWDKNWSKPGTEKNMCSRWVYWVTPKTGYYWTFPFLAHLSWGTRQNLSSWWDRLVQMGIGQWFFFMEKMHGTNKNFSISTHGTNTFLNEWQFSTQEKHLLFLNIFRFLNKIIHLREILVACTPLVIQNCYL